MPKHGTIFILPETTTTTTTTHYNKLLDTLCNNISLCNVQNKFKFFTKINPLNAKLKPICHLLTLLGAHHIFHVGRIGVNSLNVLLFYDTLMIVTQLLIYESVLCVWINILNGKIIKQNLYHILLFLILTSAIFYILPLKSYEED